MSALGWVLAVVGLVVVLAGFLQMRKGKKLAGAPFLPPSEIAKRGAQAANAKGLVSTEGMMRSDNPLIAPMSGTPCAAYEIVIEREWEKIVQTSKGSETQSGKEKAFTDYRGSVFEIKDPTGRVFVDATKKPEVDLEKTHGSKVDILVTIPGTLTFGNLQVNTPAIVNTGTRTKRYVGTERVVKYTNMFALGALDASAPEGVVIKEPKGFGSGSLVLSAKGREALVGSTKTKMIAAYAIGGVLAVGGSGLGIFGPAAPQKETAAAASLSTANAASVSTANTPSSAAIETSNPSKQPAMKAPSVGAKAAPPPTAKTAPSSAQPAASAATPTPAAPATPVASGTPAKGSAAGSPPPGAPAANPPAAGSGAPKPAASASPKK